MNLAQLNIAAMLESLESPSMADFVANLERINKLAETSPGFVWRLKDDPPVNPFGPNVLEQASMVLWWVPEQHAPTVDEAAGRLRLLRERGPTREAFTFASRFEPPGDGN